MVSSTRSREGAISGIRYRIEGELVPVLHLQLDGSTPVFFEHHVVLWKDPGLDIGVRAVKGALKRMVAGLQIFLTEARGPGELALSRDATGEVFALHLRPGTSLFVREHQFLAATGDISYSASRIRGVGSMLFGQSGFFVDRFQAERQEGVVWLHGYGNVFERVLGSGEQLDVEPGGWIYRDESVDMGVKVYGLRTGIFGGAGQLVFNRFTGPGRVGIQSMYFHLPTSD